MLLGKWCVWGKMVYCVVRKVVYCGFVRKMVCCQENCVVFSFFLSFSSGKWCTVVRKVVYCVVRKMVNCVLREMVYCVVLRKMVSCVLVRKVVVAFAFMVPDVKHNEAYISFIFTHPEWRCAGIASFMLYHLIQVSLPHLQALVVCSVLHRFFRHENVKS